MAPYGLSSDSPSWRIALRASALRGLKLREIIRQATG
jgi:hypothetical protein